MLIISTDKLDQVLDDTGNTENMVNQVLYRSFKNQQGGDKALLPTGPEVQVIEMDFRNDLTRFLGNRPYGYPCAKNVKPMTNCLIDSSA